MEADTISKNGRSSKSQTSRVNFLRQVCFILLVAGVILIGCKKDDDVNNDNAGGVLKITATNVNYSSTKIAIVKALVYWNSEYNGSGIDAIAQTQYKNNGFTLELPATVPAKYLLLFTEEVPQDVNISNKNAKGMFLEDIVGYDKDEYSIGYFAFGDIKGGIDYFTFWIYADSDVTIKGGFL